MTFGCDGSCHCCPYSRTCYESPFFEDGDVGCKDTDLPETNQGRSHCAACGKETITITGVTPLAVGWQICNNKKCKMYQK